MVAQQEAEIGFWFVSGFSYLFLSFAPLRECVQVFNHSDGDSLRSVFLFFGFGPLPAKLSTLIVGSRGEPLPDQQSHFVDPTGLVFSWLWNPNSGSTKIWRPFWMEVFFL